MLVTDLIKEGDPLIIELICGFRRLQVVRSQAYCVEAVLELIQVLMEDLLDLWIGNLLSSVELKLADDVSVLDEQPQEEGVIQTLGILVTSEDCFE